MKEKDILLYVLFLPIFFHVFTYYGFQSSYYNYRTAEHTADFYYKGIYRYRLLSREGVDLLSAVLQKIMTFDLHAKNYIVAKGTTYYHALFLFNTFFAVLVSVMLNFILKLKDFFRAISVKDRLMVVFFLAALSGFSQYVILYYDNSTVFFLLVGIYFSLKYFQFKKITDLVLLCLVIFVSTFNRETSALNIAFFGALLFSGIKSDSRELKNQFVLLIFPVLSFLLPYIILRIYFGGNSGEKVSFYESITFVHNFTNINQIAGWLFTLLIIKMIYFYSVSADNRALMTRFLILSLPYIFMIFLVGICWEIRLFIPLFYCLAVLALLKVTPKLKIVQ